VDGEEVERSQEIFLNFFETGLENGIYWKASLLTSSLKRGCRSREDGQKKISKNPEII
jgi:hypothetical protein